jgi:hypothetical protein
VERVVGKVVFLKPGVEFIARLHENNCNFTHVND